MGTTSRAMRAYQQSFPLMESALIPATTYEAKGAVYTKPWVVELLLDLAGYTADRNLVDMVAVEPAAGDGAFLEVMVERLADSCRRLKRPIMDSTASLVAYEISPESAERARNLVVTVLVRQGIDILTAENLANAWIRSADYLVESMGVEADFVIGNPPYVRLEDIPEQTVRFYRSAFPTMRGRADLYIAFFEAALRQLRQNGTCAFICADRWMRNQYGADLRELITSAFSVDVVIEMHEADPFQSEVDAYPAITVLRRRAQGSTVVASAGPEVANLPVSTLVQRLLRTESPSSKSGANSLHAAKVNSWFRGSAPWPCRSPEQLNLLRRLEEQFASLETNARVGIGVATGSDKIFVTKNPDLVEDCRLLRLAMAGDIIGGALSWSGHYLVDPWTRDGLVALERYPKLHRYFHDHESVLKARHTAQKAEHGWYRTIDRVNHSLLSMPKLYIADIKNLLDPVLDQGETYPHHNLYFIQSDDWNLEVLGGLLISSVGQFFVESYGVRMRGGYLRFQAQYLRRIRVPDYRAINQPDAEDLILAFRRRDRSLATKVALRIYGIEKREMEIALGH